jgi:hypothetical protein
MQDTQYSNEHTLPDHVEEQYSRYWRDCADKWRAMEVEIRSRGQFLDGATYSCNRSNDSERLKEVEARKLSQRHIMELLDSDIPWSKRKSILSAEVRNTVTTEKYYARSWWVDPSKTKETTPTPKPVEAGGAIPAGVYMAGLIILLTLIAAVKGC